MPDPTKRTVSASQVAALFNQSPWATRWSLWHHFKHDLRIDAESETGDRIDVGTRMEPVILGLIRDQLRLDVSPNQGYVSNLKLKVGATRDADIFDPSLGPGVVEAKNVDYLRWRDTWDDDTAPPHIELQVQAQMLVGQGAEPYRWGVIGALVGGNDLKLYRREPNEKLWKRIIEAAEEFFDDLAENREPDPLGSPVELPWIHRLYPDTDPLKVITWNDPEGFEVLEAYQDARRTRLEAEKVEKAMRVKIEGRAQDARILNVPGYEVTITRSDVEPLWAPLPGDIVDRAKALANGKPGLDAADVISELVDLILGCPGIETRKGYTRVTMKTRVVDV